jgi:hypothetical protein
MTYKIEWLSAALGGLYSKLSLTVGDFGFTNEVVRNMFPNWSESYINKSLYELVQRGWVQRVAKGRYRLNDFKSISEKIAMVKKPLEVFLEMLDKEMLVTSYLASQILTGYIHTAPKITILVPTNKVKELQDFLFASTRVVDSSIFEFVSSRIQLKVIPVNPLRYQRYLADGLEVEAYDKKIRVTDPLATLKFLSREKEDRKLADIAYLTIKFKIEEEDLRNFLDRREVFEIREIIKEEKEYLLRVKEVAVEDIVGMNLVTA